MQWGALTTAFTDGDLGRPLLVRAATTVLIVAAQTITSVMAAYAFAFLEFPFKRTLMAVCAATLLLPIEVTLIANLQTLQSAGLIDPSQGFPQAMGALTLPFLASAFGIFLIRQGFLGIPKDLPRRHAARCSRTSGSSDGWRSPPPVR